MSGQSAMLTLAEAKRMQERTCYGSGGSKKAPEKSTPHKESNETYRKGK